MVEKALLTILLEGVFVKNFLLIQFLGLCSFVGVTKDVKSAGGMSGAVVFVMALAATASYALYNFVLIPLKLEFLRTIVFIVVIAALVQLVEFILRKHVPALYRSLGIYLPLITTNCAVLGAVLINVMNDYNFIQSVTFGIAAGLGYTVAMLMMAAIREKSNIVNVPKAVGRGVTYALFVATIMSMSFVNFFGVIPLE
ncbi:MAG: electron transport complex protein RnfA [Methanosarcinaceae archaeon]|nr:electron transport complex protein RnfA [Methanosarcinaceae archaeon]MDD4496813.1 electron transport complex protein RnfA [Methanosarcinaceae archaeon]